MEVYRTLKFKVGKEYFYAIVTRQKFSNVFPYAYFYTDNPLIFVGKYLYSEMGSKGRSICEVFDNNGTITRIPWHYNGDTAFLEKP